MNRNIKGKYNITKITDISYVLKITGLLILLTLMMSSCKQQIREHIPTVEYVYHQYENGVLKETGMLHDSVKDGLWVTFYPTGTIKYIFFYQDGKKTGPQRMFHANGKLSSYHEMHNDMFNGKQMTYYSDGQIASEYFGKNDTIHGLIISYDCKGKLEYIHEYKDGEFIRTVAGDEPFAIEADSLLFPENE
jgi:hypothetical protein